MGVTGLQWQSDRALVMYKNNRNMKGDNYYGQWFGQRKYPPRELAVDIYLSIRL